MDIQNAARNAEKIVSAEDKEFRRRIANQERNLRRLLDGNTVSNTERVALLQYLADTDRLYVTFYTKDNVRFTFLSEAEDLANVGEIDIPDYAA